MWPILLKKVHPMQLFTALFGACVRSKISEKCFHVQKPKVVVWRVTGQFSKFT